MPAVFKVLVTNYTAPTISQPLTNAPNTLTQSIITSLTKICTQPPHELEELIASIQTQIVEQYEPQSWRRTVIRAQLFLMGVCLSNTVLYYCRILDYWQPKTHQTPQVGQVRQLERELVKKRASYVVQLDKVEIGQQIIQERKYGIHKLDGLNLSL